MVDASLIERLGKCATQSKACTVPVTPTAWNEGAMSSTDDGLAQTALATMLADSGVAVTPQEVAAVARALERIQATAAKLLRQVSFDDTAEAYFRLLENDRSGEPVK